jgi:hypothetical protein
MRLAHYQSPSPLVPQRIGFAERIWLEGGGHRPLARSPTGRQRSQSPILGRTVRSGSRKASDQAAPLSSPSNGGGRDLPDPTDQSLDERRGLDWRVSGTGKLGLDSGFTGIRRTSEQQPVEINRAWDSFAFKQLLTDLTQSISHQPMHLSR